MSFSITILMCERCPWGVLLNIMMSSRSAIAKGKSLSIPVISSWKYVAQFSLEKMSSTFGMGHVNFLVTLLRAL